MNMPTLIDSIQAFKIIAIWFFWFIIYGAVASVCTIPLMRIFNSKVVNANVRSK